MKLPFLDRHIILAAFWLTVLTEVGCLARTEALAARLGSPFSVCLGTLLANLLLLAAAFVLAGWIQRFPASLLRLLAALIFLLLGVLALVDRHL